MNTKYVLMGIYILFIKMKVFIKNILTEVEFQSIRAESSSNGDR